MEWKERIIVDPKVLAGKPVIKGTRLAVEFIVELLAQDWQESEILRNYPSPLIILHWSLCRRLRADQIGKGIFL